MEKTVENPPNAKVPTPAPAREILVLQFGPKVCPKTKWPWLTVFKNRLQCDFFDVTDDGGLAPQIEPGDIGAYEYISHVDHPRLPQADIKVRRVSVLPSQAKVFFFKSPHGKSMARYTIESTGTQVAVIPAFPDEHKDPSEKIALRDFNLIGTGWWTVRFVKVVGGDGPVLAAVIMHKGNK